jgi:hypothetical protein
VDGRILKDTTSNAFGQEQFTVGQKPEGEISEVSYMFARPGDPTPVAKLN